VTVVQLCIRFACSGSFHHYVDFNSSPSSQSGDKKEQDSRMLLFAGEKGIGGSFRFMRGQPARDADLRMD
jgi:hypothetical protein